MTMMEQLETLMLDGARDTFAVIAQWGPTKFVVEYDYNGAGNYRAFATHAEARAEAARLWSTEHVGRIHDHVEAAIARQVAARIDELEAALAA